MINQIYRLWVEKYYPWFPWLKLVAWFSWFVFIVYSTSKCCADKTDKWNYAMVSIGGWVIIKLVMAGLNNYIQADFMTKEKKL